MKNTLFFILTAVLVLTACTPEDKNLNRPNYSSGSKTTGQGEAKNLKVGTYGMTIWAVQNSEQIGSLVQLCLQDDKFQVITSGDAVTKTCQEKYSISSNPNDKKVALTKERWNIRLVLKTVDQAYEVVAAEGQLLSGNSSVQFGSLNAYLTYKDKSFSYARDEQGQLTLEFDGSGEIGSENDNMKFTQEFSGAGQIQGTIWKLTNFDHQLDLINKGQVFQVSATDLTLNWITPTCAEPTGEVDVIEVGRSQAQITLMGTQAQQVVQGTRRPWTRSFVGCTARSVDGAVRKAAALNLEFLFF